MYLQLIYIYILLIIRIIINVIIQYPFLGRARGPAPWPWTMLLESYRKSSWCLLNARCVLTIDARIKFCFVVLLFVVDRFRLLCLNNIILYCLTLSHKFPRIVLVVQYCLTLSHKFPWKAEFASAVLIACAFGCRNPARDIWVIGMDGITNDNV